MVTFKDERQGNRTDCSRQGSIGEGDAAGAVGTRQHLEQEEEEQGGNTKAA